MIALREKERVVRRKKMLAMRRSRLTYRAIGLNFGISGERVRQVINNINQQPRILTDKPSLATRDVARLLNVHPNTVRRWANNGTLKSYRIGSRGDRRFRQDDIEEIKH
jgi:excisionase family DNA binding protein